MIEILDGVRVLDVLAHFGVQIARRDRARGVVYVRHCPRCGPRASAAVAICVADGRWIHESTEGCRGELDTMILGFARVWHRELAAIVPAIRRRHLFREEDA